MRLFLLVLNVVKFSHMKSIFEEKYLSRRVVRSLKGVSKFTMIGARGGLGMKKSSAM